MHEASVALSILELIISRCMDEGYKSIESVKLRIGRASGIMPEALIFGFDAGKADTIAHNARLFIDIVPLGGFCSSCCSNFEVDDAYVLRCPLCDSLSFRIDRGYEMEIVDMEVN